VRSILFLEFPQEFFLPVRRQLFQFGLEFGYLALERVERKLVSIGRSGGGHIATWPFDGRDELGQHLAAAAPILGYASPHKFPTHPTQTFQIIT
jgi:hypothetical protein